jgi:hypothetical protein
MEHLLLADPNERASAGKLNQDMRSYYRKADADKDYMLKAVPWPAINSDPAPSQVSKDNNYFGSRITFQYVMNTTVSREAGMSRNSRGLSPKSKKTVTWPSDLVSE